MRYGRLLAEDAPAALIETYKQTSLENVFLSLCLKSGDDDDRESKEGSVELDSVVTKDETNSDETCDNKVESDPRESIIMSDSVRVEPNVSETENKFQSTYSDYCYDLLKWTRLKALLVKNFIRMWRNLGFLVFQFIIPTVQVSLNYRNSQRDN